MSLTDFRPRRRRRRARTYGRSGGPSELTLHGLGEPATVEDAGERVSQGRGPDPAISFSLRRTRRLDRYAAAAKASISANAAPRATHTAAGIHVHDAVDVPGTLLLNGGSEGGAARGRACLAERCAAERVRRPLSQPPSRWPVAAPGPCRRGAAGWRRSCRCWRPGVRRLGGACCGCRCRAIDRGAGRAERGNVARRGMLFEVGASPPRARSRAAKPS